MPTLLILGGTSDIGLACAHVFAKHGYDLILAARKPAMLDTDVNDLTLRHGVTVHTATFDATKTSTHKAFFDDLPVEPDGVILAFGYLGDQQKAEHDQTEANRIMNTNYLGAVSILHVVADAFEERGSGFIVGIGSAAGDRGRKSNYVYGSAKAGLHAALGGLRGRLAGKGVRVLTVKPGFVDTKMTADMELPEKLTTEPAVVAAAIWRGVKWRRNEIYVKWFWRYIMLIIRHIPEVLFKRLSI